MDHPGSTLDKNASELTVMDVYDIAAEVGQEFEKIIDQYGCEALLRLMPKVVRVLEVLEVLVSRNSANSETEELRRELERLQVERNSRHEKEMQHQKELELVEDLWRGEVQDLLSQITQLQAENKRLLVSLSLKDSPLTEEDLQKQAGISEKEQEMVRRLKDVVDKQRDDLRAKEHALTLRNEDIEALQMQQHRMMKINQDLRHRIGVVEAKGKALIHQKAELEVAAQARLQELGALQLELARLKEEHRMWQLEREINEMEDFTRTNSAVSATSTKSTPSLATTADSIRQPSVWAECEGHPGTLAGGNGPEEGPSTCRKLGEWVGYEDDDVAELLLHQETLCEQPFEEEETDNLIQQESDKPRFTLQELRDVLQEKNELKAQVFMLQEELAYYKTEESDEETDPGIFTPPPSSYPAPANQPESGIKRLIFTAIMPMVAAGLLRDDPTLMPIRRLLSFE